MSRLIAASVILLPALMAASPLLAQDGPGHRVTPTGRSVTSTGQTKPPGSGLAQGQTASAPQEQMLKAQRVARERDKAWDAKMNKTMGSICKGC